MATKQEIETLIATNLANTSNITAAEHRAVETALLNYADSQWLTGDIKEVDCTNQYIIDNFDGTGLGKNERLGWAICNGQNGTKDRSGKVSVAYGTGYSTVGDTGGASTHTLTQSEIPSHFHYSFSPTATPSNSTLEVTSTTYPVANSDGTSWGNETYRIRQSSTEASRGKTSAIGSGGAHNNMQPYIVTLFIQKL